MKSISEEMSKFNIMIQNLRHRPIYRKMKVVVGIIRLHKGLEAVKWPKSFWDEISNRVQ